ncbi:MAG: MFS transporter [Lentisphaeria bacterium]|nr:MFS transporter [Lentisphaeria bacterium]
MEAASEIVAPESAPAEEPAPRERVWRAGTLTYTFGGLVLLGLWLLGGDFPWALKDRAVTPSATLLIKQIGVSELVYGLVIVGFPNFTNTFLSPIISYVSDRHRGRWGRRIPFLLFTTPFIVLGLYGLGLTRILGSWLHGAVPSIPEHHAMLIFFCIAWVLLDFGTTLSASLFNALANDVVPPQLLGRFFGLFRMVSLGAGMVFNEWLLKRVETYTLEIFLGIGTLYAFGLLLLCFKVKEGQYPPPPQEVYADGERGRREAVFVRVMRSVLTYFRQSFSLPYYRWYMVATALAGLAFAPINYFSIQYALSLDIDMALYGRYLVITYLISLLLSFLLGFVADWFHPLRCGIITLICYAVLMFVSWSLMGSGKYFGVFFILHGFISGCYFTLTASLAARLLPRALFAQFGSAAGIVTAALSMVAGPVIGGSLDLLSHDYRYLFLFGGGITLAATLLLFKVYKDFLKYGGDATYVPPMPK